MSSEKKPNNNPSELFPMGGLGGKIFNGVNKILGLFKKK